MPFPKKRGFQKRVLTRKGAPSLFRPGEMHAAKQILEKRMELARMIGLMKEKLGQEMPPKKKRQMREFMEHAQLQLTALNGYALKHPKKMVEEKEPEPAHKPMNQEAKQSRMVFPQKIQRSWRNKQA